ncbi:general stress protein [Microbacterium esteraromaticum]|uniref:general stress protein n=1 Tax=Microbacterium esteraromaticum TaxID=57043 RepID=UPI00217551CA|nr:general stress protein [Microbacterium esteraromaticum]
MSMLNRPGNGTDLGEVIASTKDYEAAQKIVSKLIAGEVPARDIAIVGEGVRTVERVTGKLGYAAAARSGATNGVLIGLLLSAIMLFGTPDAPISLFLGFLLIGVALGMIMSLVTYSIVRRRRDFASMMQMLADHYEVRVQPASLVKARGVVGPERPQTVRPPVDLSEPPRYGERVPPAGQTGGPAPQSPASQPSVTEPAPSSPTPASPTPASPTPVRPAPAPGSDDGPVIPPKPPLPGAKPSAPRTPSDPTTESGPASDADGDEPTESR